MNKYALGIDIGGTHISAAIVDIQNKKTVPETKVSVKLNSQQEAGVILNHWVECISTCLENFNPSSLDGIGIAIPGPTNYAEGISEMQKCNKYDHLFGVNLRLYLFEKLYKWLENPSQIQFVNDASGFSLGEAWTHNFNTQNTVSITLGTGIGSSFMKEGKLVISGNEVPSNGEVYNLPFKGKRGEDHLSTNWFLDAYQNAFGVKAENVKKIAEEAISDEKAKALFDEFGTNLGSFLEPILSKFKTEVLVFGGNITRSYHLFEDTFRACFNGNFPEIVFSADTEDSAILGAVSNLLDRPSTPTSLRKTDQYVMPAKAEDEAKDSYDIYPSFEIESGAIHQGFDSLAAEISQHKTVVIDGYVGVNWHSFIQNLTQALSAIGIESIPYAISAAYKDSSDVDKMIERYLGGDDPVFGKLYTGELSDFINSEKLKNLKPDPNHLSILYGSGASLSSWGQPTIYIDVPKNEIQFRSRAGNVLNLGAVTPIAPKPQYKRMFFVDWPVLNRHKQTILKKIDYIVDEQYEEEISWCTSDTLQGSLKSISQNAFRVRPWFEPGIWGGQWIKNKIDGLNKDVINYAWSFELIVPENGLVISKNGVRLEYSFDLLMFNDNQAVLGDAAPVFGNNFPIRFDFLDTYDGANLSLQCHPKPEFIKEQFGEPFTQDETYYMLDAAPDAEVYLGFQENIDSNEFHEALKTSNVEGKEMDVKKYVQVHPAKKHDLFLIPHGTVHCSGKNGLVLEISSTPYIYTFKMYDWMRTDLDGNPRPLNIERGMKNLNFDCKGDHVQEAFISKQTVVEEGSDWRTVKLNTHPKHFYEVSRFEFVNEMEITTEGQCHILSLVEGQHIEVITNGRSMDINYAETFVIPASSESYRLINKDDIEVKVVQSNVKPKVC